MLELHPDSQVGIFRLILEFENRCEQIDAIVSHIKDTFLTDPTTISVPEVIGILDELRWHLDQTTGQIDSFQTMLGAQRRAGTHTKKPARRINPHDLRGSTANLSIPDLLHLLSKPRKTGTLWIKSSTERFVLELLDGDIVHLATDSPRPEERLGMILVAKNRISLEKLDQFLDRYDSSAGRIGEAMARASLVSETDLRDALQHQVQELFQRIASVDKALFCFREGKVSELELRVCLNVSKLLTTNREDDTAATDEELFGDEAAGHTPESAHSTVGHESGNYSYSYTYPPEAADVDRESDVDPDSESDRAERREPTDH